MTQNPERAAWREELRALAAAADPGPWRTGSADDDTAMRAHFVARGDFRPGRWPDPHQVVAVTLLQSPNLALSDLDRQNTSFIAASRDGIPRLLAEGDRLLVRHQRTVETLRRVLPEITRQVGEHHATVESLRGLLSELESS